MGGYGLKNAGEEKSLEVNLTAKTLPFMLARSPFHLLLLPEEKEEGEVDLEGEAGGVTQCMQGERAAWWYEINVNLSALRCSF